MLIKLAAGLALLALLLLGILWTARCDGAKALALGLEQPGNRAHRRLLVWAAVLVGLATALGLLSHLPAVHTVDAALLHAFHRTGEPWVNRGMIRISRAGGRDLALRWLPLILVGLLLARRARSLRFFAFSMLGTVGIQILFKELIQRPRPVTVRNVAFDSYPSGHTLAATILAGLLFLILLPYCRRPWHQVVLGASLAAWPLAMATARVYMGAHYPLDVLGAVLLGTAWVCACVVLLRWRTAALSTGLRAEG